MKDQVEKYACKLVAQGLVEKLVVQGKMYYRNCLEKAASHPALMQGPFDWENEAVQAICEVGRLTVEKKMVDSFFGNISYRLGNTVYISQTASSLDELEGCVDPCALDDSRCTAITASSEYPAHKSVYLNSDHRAILRGHPRFSVIASLLCEQRETCADRNHCHTKCKQKRLVGRFERPKRIYRVLICVIYQLSASFFLSWGSGLESKSTSLNSSSTESSSVD